MSAASLVDKTISLPKKTKGFTEESNPADDTEINAAYLKQLKSFLRSNPSQSKDVIRHITLCLKKRNKVVALRALIVLNILFERSHDCRNEIEASVKAIASNCGINISLDGTRKQKVLSRKRKQDALFENATTTPTYATIGLDVLMKQCILILKHWDTMFGDNSEKNMNAVMYPNIHTLVRYINEKYATATDVCSTESNTKNDRSHTSIQDTIVSMKRDKADRKANALRVLELKSKNVVKEAEESLQDIRTTIHSLRSLFVALFPPVDENEEVCNDGNENPQDINGGSEKNRGVPSYLVNAVYESDTDSCAPLFRDDESDGSESVGFSSSDEEYDDILWETDVKEGNADSVDENGANAEYGSYLNSIYTMPSISTDMLAQAQMAGTHGGHHRWLGNRNYSMKLAAPQFSSGSVENASSDANSENSQSLVDIKELVDELSTHLTKVALPKLEYWKRVLDLVIKYSIDDSSTAVHSNKIEELRVQVRQVLEDLLFLLARKKAVM